MHAREKNRTYNDPDKSRQPAPNDRDTRTDNGGGSSDCSEVVSPQDKLIGWHIVDVVSHRMGRGLEIGVKSINLFSYEPRVEAVASEDCHQTCYCKNDRVHCVLSFRNLETQDTPECLLPHARLE